MHTLFNPFSTFTILFLEAILTQDDDVSHIVEHLEDTMSLYSNKLFFDTSF